MTSSSLLLTFEIADLPAIFGSNDDDDDAGVVVPVSQADGPTAVCRIDYPPAFVQAYDYFRGVLRSSSKAAADPRVLRLTELCLTQNPANYTVWQFRRQCLYALAAATTEPTTNGNDIDTTSASNDKNTTSILTSVLVPYDLALCAQLGGDNPKNYQIWYHRRAILTKVLAEPLSSSSEAHAVLLSSELHYVADVLHVDAKNYHAWSHRQWVLVQLASLAHTNTTTTDDTTTTTVWDTELAYTDTLLQQDVRNNSAWNQRWFVVMQQQQQGNTANADDTIARWTAEADYALARATQDPYNESPFTYFGAICKHVRRCCTAALHHKKNDHDDYFSGTFLPTYMEKLQAVVGDSSGNNDVNNMCIANTVSPYWLAARVELLLLVLSAESNNNNDNTEMKEQHESSVQLACTLLDQLAQTVDPIRRKYWHFRKSQLLDSVK